ncbi:MAG: tail fiber domain-containing protein [Chitinophagaceae bacterium]|nr:tail fiber domain-containing protein [Chitinophagaceae bacterium]
MALTVPQPPPAWVSVLIHPGARLHVRRNGASGGSFIGNPSMIIEDNTQSYVQLSNPTNSENGILSGSAISTIRSGIVFGIDSAIFLRAGGNVNRIIVDNNGYVGVGTTAPNPLTQFHLYEPLLTDVNLRVASVNGSYVPGLELTKGIGGADWKLFNGTGNLLTLARATDDFVTTPQNYQMSGVTAYRPQDNVNSLGLLAQRWTTVYATTGTINTSDRRDKENITDLNYGLKEIMKLRPVSFTWKDNPQWGKKIGFIAQEVQPILGEVVQVGELKSKNPSKDADNDVAKKETDKLGIYYSDIIPVTVKAIQEQQQTIQSQQKAIDELKKKNEQLEKDVQLIKAKLGINN